MTSHWTYRLLNRDGGLLYVGYSQDISQRLKQHAKDKAWWPEVERVEVLRHASRGEALDFERQAILDDGPLHNHARYQTVGGKTPLKSFRIPQALYDAAMTRAESEGLSLTDVVRTSLIDYVEEGQ